jgi:hypothetical protein
MDDKLISAIDQWREKLEGEPTRPEAIRRMVEIGRKMKGTKA